MPDARYTCWTKVTDRLSGPPRLSLRWLSARRGWFRIFDDHVACGDWQIPFDSVEQAIAYRFVGPLLLPATVLEIQTRDKTYQFGFLPWAQPLQHVPFGIEQRRVVMF